ncbi:MAG: hypothetical protein PVJ40_09795, partial [Gammaproteobacteria bacterium]
LLRNIERLLRKDLPRIVVEGFAPDPSARPAPEDRHVRGRRSPRSKPHGGSHRHDHRGSQGNRRARGSR